VERDSVIVRADDSHLEAAWTIITRCRAALSGTGIHQWDDVYPTRETVLQDLAHGALYMLVAGTGCQATIALDDRQEEAYGALSWSTEEPALVVHRLCVDPAFQGHGLAHRVMDFVEAHAQAHHYRSIRLDAYSGNPAATGLYRRRGYRAVGEVFFPRRPLPFVCFERAVPSRPSSATSLE
jgi:ribosomal protein S18 acetylase RimI-like enzyme